MNLTPEQLELLLCLLGALTIGFLFGYFLARARARKRYGAELEEFSDLLDTRDREIESSSAKYGQLKQHTAVQANELKEINQKVVDTESLIGQYKDDSKLLGDEKTKLQSLLMGKEKRISELIDEVDLSKNELGSVQNLVNEYKHVSTTHNKKLLVAQNEIEQNAKLNHSLIKRTEEKMLEVKALQEQKQSLDSKVDILTKSLDEKENVIGEYKKRTVEKEALMRENQALKVKVENISKTLEESRVEVDDSEIIKLEQKYNNLQQSFEDVKKEVSQKDTNIVNLQKSFEDANKQIAEKDIGIVNLQKDKNRLEEQTKTIQSQQSSSHEALQNEVLNIKAELFRKDKKLKSLEEKLKLNQPLNASTNASTEKKSSQQEAGGFMKFVKDTFSSGDKKKNS